MPADKDGFAELLAGQVRELMRLVDETDIAELKIEKGDLKLHITKGYGKEHLSAAETGAGEPTLAEEPKEQASFVQSPMVGRFFRSAPGKDPLVDRGSPIAKGQAVCVVESMKMLNEVQSEHDGEVDEILCEDGQVVEYGQPLFRLRALRV